MKTKINTIIIKFLLVLFALSAVYPIIWMTINSFKTANEVISNPLGLPQTLRFGNYMEAVQAFDFFSVLAK